MIWLSSWFMVITKQGDIDLFLSFMTINGGISGAYYTILSVSLIVSVYFCRIEIIKKFSDGHKFS